MRPILLSLSLVACGEFTPGAAHHTGVAPPPQITTLEVTALVPGEPLSFRVTGLPPGKEVMFFASMGGPGTGPCHPAGTICLDVTGPLFQLGRSTANGSGVATKSIVAPPSIPTSNVWFQAAILTNGVTDVVQRLVGDGDLDGFTGSSDCDESDPATYVGAPDLLDPDRVDSNCDSADGIRSQTLYVDPRGTGTACTLLDPCGSLSAASIEAATSGATQVFMSAGTYSGVAKVAAELAISGGYDSSWRQCDPTLPSCEVKITGGVDGVTGQAMGMRVNADGVTLLHLEISSPDGADATVDGAAGQNSVALLIEGAGTTVMNVELKPGNGGDGAAGFSQPFGRADVTPGMEGDPGFEFTGTIPTCEASGFDGGDGGFNLCGTEISQGGTGGQGGAPDTVCPCTGAECLPGPAGDGEDGADAVLFGAGGAGSPGCTATPESGQDGRDGFDGSGGEGGFQSLSMIGGVLTGEAGQQGTLGTVGRGGGGQGGYASCTTTQTPGGGLGRSGGGGGAGGCSGVPNGGGGPGGNSIGAVIHADATLADVRIVRGIGGRGGDGAIAMLGQFGALGGYFSQSSGQRGGTGGNGGAAGGSGGGAGGHTVGIAVDQSVATSFNDVTYVNGGTGGGGQATPVPGGVQLTAGGSDGRVGTRVDVVGF